MIYAGSSENYRPVMWLNGYPISMSILLIILHTSLMILFTLAKATGHAELFNYFIFSSEDLLHRGAFWQLITYAFVALPSLNFALQMLMLYWFGPDVERFIGRSAFIGLYLSLLIVPALFLTLVGLNHPVEYSGTDNLLFGFFIAFVTIYPNVEVFFLRMTAKWLAWIFLGIYSLIYLSERAVLELSLLWLCAGIGYFAMRLVGVGGSLAWWERLREEKKSQAAHKVKMKAKPEPRTSIDAILEKISRKGMESLTPAERASLEKARSALLKRDENK